MFSFSAPLGFGVAVPAVGQFTSAKQWKLYGYFPAVKFLAKEELFLIVNLSVS